MSSTSSTASMEKVIKTHPPKQDEPRSYTPDTVLSEINLQPDITVLCQICGKHIAITRIQDHRTYHNALDLLDYKANRKPESLESLLARRRHLVHKASRNSDSENPTSTTKIQKINGAYELVKSHIQGTFDDLHRTKEPIKVKCTGQALNCSAACIHALSICSNGNERWKSRMEDNYVFQDYFGNDINKCFFAVYDGYNGRFTADITAYDLHHFLLNEMTKFDPNTACKCSVNHAGKIYLEDYDIGRKPAKIIRKDSIRHILHKESMNVIQQIMHTCEENVQELKQEESPSVEGRRSKRDGKKKRVRDPFAEKMEDALQRAYAQTDNILKFGVDEQSRVRWSGCSAVTCVIQNTCTELDDIEQDDDSSTSQDLPLPQERGVVYIANAGNVRAVMCRNGKTYRLTRDHTPSNVNEVNRVLKAGVDIKATQTGARVNGVLDTTRGFGNHGDPDLKKAVIVDPYTTTVSIDQYAEFLIIATNGLWEVLSDEEAVSILYEMMTTDEIPSPIPDNNVDKFAQMYGQSNHATSAVHSTSEGDHLQQNNVQKDKSPIEMAETFKQYPSANDATVSDGAVVSKNVKTPAVIDNGLPGGYNVADSRPASYKDDFESMISTLMENDDCNDADIETLTELHTYYAQSQLSTYQPTEEELYRNLAKNMSERLVQSALLAGSRDNVTVMVILLPACKI